MDPLILAGMSNLFAGTVAQFQQVQALANAANQQLANLTNNVFLQMTQLYQAMSAQLAQTNKMASDILAQRSAEYQPQVNAQPAAA
jgi:hypothetical protein